MPRPQTDPFDAPGGTFRQRLPSRINLRRLVLALALFCALATLLNVLYASYRVQRDTLVQNTLDSNRAYAAKLAEAVDLYLDDARQEMALHAQALGPLWNNRPALMRRMAEINGQSRRFNSVGIIGADRRMRAVAPASLFSDSVQINTEFTLLALREKKPLISDLYTAFSGRLLIVISHPIFASDGTYLGYLGGTVYLQAGNVLNGLLAQHFYGNGSYVYVIDRSRRLIYHPDASRLGQAFPSNPIMEAALAGKPGAMRALNVFGVDMLAGYATMNNGWGVIVQRPIEDTYGNLNAQMLRILLYLLPLMVVGLPFVWWLSNRIARPLWQVATQAQRMDLTGARDKIIGIDAWYFEAAQIKHSMLVGLDLLTDRIHALDEASSTDPLTGLLNRRGMQAWLDAWHATKRPFAALALDIDHFKQVNDTWGHDTGDRVLQHVAALIRESLRQGDVLCRSGGEEFFMLLPDTPLPVARDLAERLRARVETTRPPAGDRLTVSLGVAHLPATGHEPSQVLKQADVALYKAKREGRNRVVSATV